MKISTYIVMLMISVVATTFYAMDLTLTLDTFLEQALVNDGISIEEYLRRIETNPSEEGVYSDMVRKMRTAEIANLGYRHGFTQFYVAVQDDIEALVYAFKKNREIELLDQFGNFKRSRLINIFALKVQIRRAIKYWYDDMKDTAGRAGAIVKGRST